ASSLSMISKISAREDRAANANSKASQASSALSRVIPSSPAILSTFCSYRSSMAMCVIDATITQRLHKSNIYFPKYEKSLIRAADTRRTEWRLKTGWVLRRWEIDETKKPLDEISRPPQTSAENSNQP